MNNQLNVKGLWTNILEDKILLEKILEIPHIM